MELRPSNRPLRWPAAIAVIRDILAERASLVYLVGGVVRDAYWRYDIHDIDLAVKKGAFSIARQIADSLGGAFYKLDPARETGRAIVEIDDQKFVIDVARFRGDDLESDLLGRDFTINAVAAPLSGPSDMVFDPLNGLDDAQHRILRRCNPDSIASDPARVLRAVRMSIRFSLRIEPLTLSDIRKNKDKLSSVSPERLRDEFMALLGGKQPAGALRTLHALGLLSLIVPEVVPMQRIAQSPPHQFDLWQHVLQTIQYLDAILQTISPGRTDNTAASASLGMIVYYLDKYRAELNAHLQEQWPNERSHRAFLMLAALLHDSGKPATASQTAEKVTFHEHEITGAELAEKRCNALRLSRQEAARLRTIVRHHMRPHLLHREKNITRRAIYRFWRDCGPAGVDICLLALADYLATAGSALSIEQWSHYLLSIDALLGGYLGSASKTVVNLPVLVTGHDLIKAFDLKPGPHIGAILEQIREAQAAGEIQTAEEALDFARTLK